ncbi:hypothetical protein ACS0TY_025600 [Phlomoides rotata]
MKSFGNHISPEKEEQLNRAKIEVENKVKKILKLAKGINGNKDGNLKKKSEIIHLIEDFHQHYESLYSTYDDLRGKLKNHQDDDPSSSQSDSESYYSPVESTPKRSSSHDSVEDTTILKDKLTSSSEVRDKTASPSSAEFNEKTTNELELEAEVARLKLEIETMKRHWEEQENEKKSRVLELECEVKALSVEKGEWEKMKQEEAQELQTSLSEAASAAQEKIYYKACENVKNLENKVEVLQSELEEMKNDKKRYVKEKQDLVQSKLKMERKNTELTSKIGDQQRTLLELGDAMNKLKSENEKARFLDWKPNIQAVEKKIEEMAEELRRQFEDKYRILSRRIRVAEQLHVENREWYRKSKEEQEQEKKEMQENIRSIKDMSVIASEMAVALDSMVLKMEECNANFLNRISKASCELMFAKEWARRKNKALVHVKQDVEGLLSQLDEKEAEILVYREKVWRWENKMREMEKVMKKKEDEMVGLQEEKREAIRQLCVWIDYHRSRCDYYMKMLFDMNARRRKA